MNAEERAAWDRFADAALHSLGALAQRGDGWSPEALALTAAAYADALLAERRKRVTTGVCLGHEEP